MAVSTKLLDIDTVLEMDSGECVSCHKEYGNSGLAGLLCMLGLDKKFVRAEGSYIWDKEENRYLDFLSGYGSVSIGHNHPKVLEAMHKVEKLPNILQVSLGAMAGALANNLAAITPGDLQRTFFGNSGCEAVEGALKLSRAAIHHDRRDRILQSSSILMCYLGGILTQSGHIQCQSKPRVSLYASHEKFTRSWRLMAFDILKQ